MTNHNKHLIEEKAPCCSVCFDELWWYDTWIGYQVSGLGKVYKMLDTYEHAVIAFINNPDR